MKMELESKTIEQYQKRRVILGSETRDNEERIEDYKEKLEKQIKDLARLDYRIAKLKELIAEDVEGEE